MSTDNPLSRRSFLKAAGGAAASAKAARDVAMEKLKAIGLGYDSGVSSVTRRAVRADGLTGLSSRPFANYYEDGVDFLKKTLAPWRRAELRMERLYVGCLDVDIMELRSVSVSGKIGMQRRRQLQDFDDNWFDEMFQRRALKEERKKWHEKHFPEDGNSSKRHYGMEYD